MSEAEGKQSAVQRPAAYARQVGASLCALLLVACTFPGSVKPTIKIGLSAPFEGLYRDLGYEVLHATRLAVRERNAAGGPGGRFLVELVALNDFDEPDEVLRQAQEMAVDPGILAVLGGWSPEAAHTAAPEYTRLGLALLAPYGADNLPALAAEAARLAIYDLRARTAAILYSPDPVHQTLAREFASTLVSHEVSIAIRSAAEGGDWPVHLELLGPGGRELLFLAGDASQAAHWLSEARAAGFRGPILGGPDLGSPLVVDLAGGRAEGVLFVSPLPVPLDDPTFLEGYLALSGGVPPGPAAGWAYRAAHRLLDSLDQVARQQRPPTRAAVAAALAVPPAEESSVYVYTIWEGKPFVPYR